VTKTHRWQVITLTSLAAVSPFTQKYTKHMYFPTRIWPPAWCISPHPVYFLQ